MDNELKKPTKKAGTSSNSPKTTSSRMSAEDKLKKSLKNLSYTSGGSSGGATSKKTTTKSTAIKTEASRKKVGGVVLDVETIQDATKQKLATRGRRNAVIILVLSLLLVVSLVYLAIVIVQYKSNKRKPNCNYYIAGDAGAEWIVEGKANNTSFKLRKGLGTNTIYLLNSKLKINTAESVMLTIEIEVLLDGEPILIAGLHEANAELIRVSKESNKFVYQSAIAGGGTIFLFEGIDFSEAPSQLASNNVTISITANANVI